MGLTVAPLLSDGRQPVGRGIGPALEARDVLAVLRREPRAPRDLEARALTLAGRLLEFSAKVPPGTGAARAREILEDGRAWKKFTAIAEAQGGLREPPHAPHTRPVPAPRAGVIAAIDNRKLARAAKLAGAPHDPAAGIELHAPLGARVAAGEPLYTLHAQTPGELTYAWEFVAGQGDIIKLDDTP